MKVNIDEIMVSEDAYQQVKAFRKDYDKLMDAVHYFSVMRGTPEEDDAIARLRQAYQYNQDKWGG